MEGLRLCLLLLYRGSDGLHILPPAVSHWHDLGNEDEVGLHLSCLHKGIDIISAQRGVYIYIYIYISFSTQMKSACTYNVVNIFPSAVFKGYFLLQNCN